MEMTNNLSDDKIWFLDFIFYNSDFIIVIL